MTKIYETIKNSNNPPSNISGAGTGILQPKVTHQWKLKATGAMNDNSLFSQVISCSRPSLTFAEIELPRNPEVPGHRVVVAGKHCWEPLTLVVEDDLHGNAARVIEKQIHAQMNDDPMSSKFDLSICAMDGNDIVADVWNMTGCFIQEVNYADLEYSASRAVQITLTILFDNAQMELPELAFITD